MTVTSKLSAFCTWGNINIQNWFSVSEVRSLVSLHSDLCDATFVVTEGEDDAAAAAAAAACLRC